MALKRIVLHDFVIVQALELDLHEGFTALTGETGAGKSILVEALQLILGARADAACVREGAARADLCAEFDLPPHLAPWLEEAGFEATPELLLRRTIDAAGKSRAWINGLPATATQLRHLGEQLLDIHGQHAWQSLMRAGAIRDLLDAYAGTSCAAVTACWTRWQAALKACADARAAQDQLQQERERLQWQLAEMDKLDPGAGEWAELNTQHTRLTHAQSLLEAAHAAREWLDAEDGGARNHLARALDVLQRQEHLEPAFQDLAAALASILAQTDDALRSLHAYLAHTDIDPARLEQLDARVAEWIALARRYKRPPEELPALRQSWQQALQRLDAASDLAALEQEARAQAQAYEAAAQALSQARAQTAPRLSQQITAAMQDLGMAGGRFVVQLRKAAAPAAHGIDDIDFLVAGHPGATPRPIGKIASGGELSRISLAIAVATSTLGRAGTLIFDEVDAGVGGAVAASVGRLMRQIGQDRQVLAVTHLPQVAACAHHHLVVTKRRGEPTTSSVTAVQDEARVAEVARMLGGERPTAHSLAHAREMLGAPAHERG
ncbi:DNA repair protein RecN [Comamonas granuli]|uniref:DNA repair protein RecN n=1 Tax=Comamonas granuli TaxID=290309 RepID=UPI0005A727C3|nr:DNA repair protein RecN [Comamonas granuli]